MLISLIGKRKNELIFFLIFFLFFYRSPFIFLNGRFMAEEGSIFFANAYKYSFFYSLFFVDFNSGYFNLWANISGIISNFFDLKLSPLISNYISLVPKIIIVYITLYKTSFLLIRFEHKILFCFITFFSPLSVPEIWMNSINSQIFFCMLSFLIIFEKYQQIEIKYSRFLIIFFAGLSGVYSCVLSPVFFLKYYTYKTRQDYFNFIIISFCTITQLLLIIYSKFSNLIYSGKIHSINLDIFINYVYNVIVKPFLGTSLTKHIYINYINYDLTYVLSAVVLVFFLFVVLIYLSLKKLKILNITNNFILISVIYSFLSVSLLVMVGAVAEYVGGRYAALPSFFILCFVLAAYIFFDKYRVRFLILIPLVISISTGFYEYRPPTKNVKHQYLKHLDCINCPNWEKEVNKFYEDKNYYLKIWPYPKKIMKLN